MLMLPFSNYSFEKGEWLIEADGDQSISGPDDTFISKKLLNISRGSPMSYVSKVTSAGQVTLPKKVRDALGIGPGSYIVVDAVGEAAILRKMDVDHDTLEKIREKVRKTGLTRKRVEEIVEDERAKLWNKGREKGLRGR